MIEQKLAFRAISLAIAAALITGVSIHASKSWARPQNNSKELVDEAWQILQQDYVDGTFNHHDWQAVRQEYLNRSYSSKQQAYRAIQEIVVKLGDPYTVFFNPQEYKQFNSRTSGKLTGVGVELSENEKTKALTVVNTLKGTPAFAAGILPHDVIVKVNGQDIQGMKSAEAVKLILGPVGTQVVFTIQRGGQELSFKLTRANIELYPVSYHTQMTAIGDIGYIRLPEFTDTAAAQMRQAIAALETQQVKGYILDLRADPGGRLDASLAIAKMWLKQGTIVSLVKRAGIQDRFTTHGPALTNKPLVVLVDGGSASASEILAAALQDNGRATLVGTRTFGKGLVQSVQELKDGSGLKVTIAKYYTPKGLDINHVGVIPGVVVGLTDAQQKAMLIHQTLGTTADPQYANAVTQLSRLIQTEAKMPLAVKPDTTQTVSPVLKATSSNPTAAPITKIPKPSQHWVKVTVASDNAQVDIDAGTVTQASGVARFWQRNKYTVSQANGIMTALLYQSINCQQQTYQFFKEITLDRNDQVLHETRDGQLSTVFPVAAGTPSSDLFKRFCQ